MRFKTFCLFRLVVYSIFNIFRIFLLNGRSSRIYEKHLQLLLHLDLLFFYLNNCLKKEKKEKRYNFWIRSSPLLEENKQSISYIYFKNRSY